MGGVCVGGGSRTDVPKSWGGGEAEGERCVCKGGGEGGRTVVPKSETECGWEARP